MDGYSVIAEELIGAASKIVSAMGGVAAPKVAGGVGYGHDQLGALVVEFGDAVHVAYEVLGKSADSAAAGLRANAASYDAQERAGGNAVRAAGGR